MHSSNSQIEYNKELFSLADEFLLGLVKTRILKSESASDAEARQVLVKYLTPDPRPQSMTGRDGIFHRMAYTAQDWGSATNVIGKCIGGIENLDKVLFDFNPHRVVEKYPTVSDWGNLLDAIVAELKPKGEIRREEKSLWPKYCRTLISGAIFLSQFKSAEEFYDWTEPLEKDATRRIELPSLVEQKITGFGFALSCIFFMDIGYASFLKADTWVIQFCNVLKITESKKPRAVFDAAILFAEQVGVTPFCLDRMIWLIGSGKFYRNDDLVVNGQLEKFATFADEKMKKRARMERFVWKEGDIEIIKPGNSL